MYVRTVAEQDLRFQVSGMLWQRSLVMRDLETETLWSHILGRGMRGKHEGVELEMLPAAMTSWADWKKRYPETTLLAMRRTARKYRERVWSQPQNYVFGIEKPTLAVGIEKMQAESIVEVEVEGQRVLLTHTEEGGSVQAFDGGEYTFEMTSDGRMKDKGTGSIWDMAKGIALVGEFKDRQLTEIPGTISYRTAWKGFYPESVIVD